MGQLSSELSDSSRLAAVGAAMVSAIGVTPAGALMVEVVVERAEMVLVEVDVTGAKVSVLVVVVYCVEVVEKVSVIVSAVTVTVLVAYSVNDSHDALGVTVTVS